MYLGIDVGGMSFKAGLVDDDFRIVDTETCEAAKDAENYGEYLAAAMAGLSRRLLERNSAWDKVACVGAGIPGFVDPADGAILFTPNLPLEDVPISELFSAVFPLPLRLGNDANCAALGEYYAGCGGGAHSMLMYTLGTGVGTGFITEGRIFTGWNGAAVEAGHLLLELDGKQCGCGRRGCFEAYGSATALIRDAREAMALDHGSLLWDTAGGGISGVNGKSILEAVHRGDKTASQVWARYLHYLAEGILSGINVFQPELVCIGGGIGNAAPEDLLFPLQKLVEGRSLAKGSRKQPKLVKARLGNEAGMIGAALLGK